MEINRSVQDQKRQIRAIGETQPKGILEMEDLGNYR